MWFTYLNFYSCNYTALFTTYLKKAQILYLLIRKLIDPHKLSKLWFIFVEMELMTKKYRNDNYSSPQLIWSHDKGEIRFSNSKTHILHSADEA